MPIKRWLASLAAQSVTQSAAKRVPMPSTLQQRLGANPAMRFENIAELQAAAALGVRIDVAQATQDDWLRLPGLSIHQARMLGDLVRAGLQLHCLDDLAAALGLSVNQVAGYGPILQFCFYDEDERSQLCNANSASAEALHKLPVLSEALADAILQERQTQGPFLNLADFQRRMGLGAEAIGQLMHYLRF